MSCMDPTMAPALMASIGSSTAAPLAKFAVAFPLVYHYGGAIRHTYWDYTAKGLYNADVAQSTWILAGSSTMLSLALSSM